MRDPLPLIVDLRVHHHFRAEIILVQLDKSEINYVSKRLEQDYSIVHCVDITELADFIKRRELKCHEK